MSLNSTLDYVFIAEIVKHREYVYSLVAEKTMSGDSGT